MINQKRIRLTKLALALSIALSAAPSFAQNTTSAIGGRISGADGKPAAGATVSIVHTESGSVSNVKADAEGRYAARGLRVGGPYTIIITKDGVTEKREGVYLQLAETASVDAQLGAPMQVVTIGGTRASDKFNKATMGAGTNIGRGELNALGSVQRNLADYARNDPRLSQTDKERGEISAGGQNSRFNTITVDGVSISDRFGLEANGTPTAKQPISIDAIQSVQVNISNYDVSQKGYTGANINAVTKSGTNEWKGSIYTVYRDDRTTGKRFNATTGAYTDVPAYQEKTKGFTLGGPLVKDKLFFFINAEDQTSSRASPTFGPLGSVNLTNTAITPSSIASLQNIAKTKYGFDAGSSDVPTGYALKVSDRLAKLDWNISDDHRASLRYQKTDQAEPQFSGYSASGIALQSYLWTEQKAFESTVAQWFGDWTPTFSTELRVSTDRSLKHNANNAFLPSMALSFGGPLPAGTPAGVPNSGNRFINFGTEASRQLNELSTKSNDVYFAGNWTLDAHEVKFGGDFNKTDVYNAFLQNVNGTYTFGCSNSTATFTYTIGTVNCATSPATQIEAAVLENFSRARPTSYQAQLAANGFTIADAAARFTTSNYGLFLQDTWAVNPSLNLTYGLRVDAPRIGNLPAKNNAVAAPMVAGVYNTNPTLIKRQTGGYQLDNQTTINHQDTYQPRFGFNYKLQMARPTQLRGGAGLFQGAALNVWLGNSFANPGVITTVVGCGTGSFSACPGTDGLFNPDPTKQKAIAGVAPAALVNALAPDFKQPSVYKANLGFDHELPWYGIVFTAEYLYTQVHTGLYYQNLNLGAPTRIGPDGREMYFTEPGYTASCANGNGGFLTSGACAGYRAGALANASYTDVLVAKNTKKGGGNLMTLGLTSGRSPTWKWAAAYTYTDATEVSPLNSSTARSGWSGRAAFNPNEEVAANSSYLVRNRVNANLTWEKRFFGAYKTTFGAMYEGKNGKPYSWTFNNDMNGDTVTSNDLMFIPKAFGSGEVIFRGDTATSQVNEQKFWDIVNSNKELLRARGGVTQRNDSFAPWTNSIDLRLSQEVPGLFAGNRGVFVLDFANFGNLLNKRWGRINEVGFASAGGNARSFVDYAGMQDGKYVYQVRDLEAYVQKQVRNESQWAIQATVRYEF
ncbi:MAG: TonB-dependent receptor [Pseudomonadota bacterium]|nr:TonB-dependent receptor [Pseudomonadota bacterium]